jgi:hypothetical protein
VPVACDRTESFWGARVSSKKPIEVLHREEIAMKCSSAYRKFASPPLEQSLLQRLQLKAHVLLCRACRLAEKQFRRLEKSLQPRSLSDSDSEKVKEEILKKLIAKQD